MSCVRVLFVNFAIVRHVENSQFESQRCRQKQFAPPLTPSSVKSYARAWLYSSCVLQCVLCNRLGELRKSILVSISRWYDVEIHHGAATDTGYMRAIATDSMHIKIYTQPKNIASFKQVFPYFFFKITNYNNLVLVCV